MPKLTVQLGGTGVDPKACLEIAQDTWGQSDNAPLATVGAGPCMNVVVHAGDTGCLAHIWNSSLNQHVLYQKACRTVKSMIMAIDTPYDIEIWLGAGHAFHQGSRHVPGGAVGIDFIEYLRRFLDDGYHGKVKFHDYRTPSTITEWDPGSVVYAPTTGTIYILSNRDEGHELVIAVRSGKNPAVRGTCGA